MKEVISRAPLTGSRKIYVSGKIHDIKVAMREISLTDTVNKFNGKTEKNLPVTVYDTSGPYTDPEQQIDLKKGLPRLREQWILNRGDVEQLPEFSSEYCRARMADKNLDSLRFEHIQKPLKAKAGANVSQMHYAKKGIITPEMEYIAIR
ncbi:MAG TPA: phosphomethylpyrimidine synthase ThiC, partial [Cytophagales bacterium]|nr:phosphomethylpyrimidine synthase ThiC [Cytophagales bacterium]